MSAALRVYLTGSKSVAVPDLAAASEACCDYRDKSGVGSSRWRGGLVIDSTGTPVARVSYNGRVWDTSDWTPTHRPALLFDPFGEEAAR